MIHLIKSIISKHINGIVSCNNIFIVDYKNSRQGEVEISCDAPIEKYVELKNERNLDIFYDLFQDNALVIEAGNHSKQCECVLFPTTCGPKDWILFIETKYANNLEAAFATKADYPNCMIEQIIATVHFFRRNGIIPQEKRATAILSFPNLIEDFSESFIASCNESIEDILINHNILVRPSNQITIKSNQRLKI